MAIIKEIANAELDLEIIHQWDDKSLQVLYRHFYKALVGFSVQIVQDEHQAEDIVQEVFFNTWKKKNIFQTIGTLKAYLYNSVRNECINYMRHQQVLNSRMQQVEKEYREMLTDDDNDLLLHKEEVYRQLFQAIDELPPKQREIFLMAMKGKKNTEIAEAMNISVNTVKSQKRRGIEVLREHMNPDTFVLLMLLIS